VYVGRVSELGSLPPIALPPRYRAGALLGRGAFGAVIEAHDLELHRDVAIKILLGSDPSDVARFANEATTGAAVSHPCLLHILDAGRCAGGEHFVVMERLVGETLGERVATGRLLSGVEAARILEDLLGALRALEARRMVHRDIKPSNVFVAEMPGGDRITKLIDFGLAKLLELGAALTGRGMIVGSPGYLAPERYQGAEATTETDFYAVGATLFESLTGSPPFSGESPTIIMAQVLSAPAPRLATRCPDLDAVLAERIQALLDRDPAVRRRAAEASRLATIEVRPTSRPPPPETKSTHLDGIGPALARALPPSRVPTIDVHVETTSGGVPTPPSTSASDTVLELEPQDRELEALLERYRLVRRIGAGGMGIVYEARDRALDRPVALKVLKSQGPIGDDAIDRLEREARTAARLGHPNIVAVSDFGRVPGRGAYLVMELLAGESLARRLTRKGRLPSAEVTDIALQVLDALATAHRAGVVHRDLKPENIHLVPLANGQRLAKLLDFGIVKLREGTEKRLTERGVIIGTPHYMAPEQVELEDVDARTDVYAMGATMYQMLAGTLPYDADTPQRVVGAILEGPPVPLAVRARDIDPRLVAVVERAMARDRTLRFDDAGVMRDALLALEGRPLSTMLVRDGAPAVSHHDAETKARPAQPVVAHPSSQATVATPKRARRVAPPAAVRAPARDARIVGVAVVVAIVVVIAAIATWLGRSADTGVVPGVPTPPGTAPPVTAPPATTPPVTAPPATTPPVTAPPVTAPPVTAPPATTPPVPAPPATTAPVTAPPTIPTTSTSRPPRPPTVPSMHEETEAPPPSMQTQGMAPLRIDDGFIDPFAE
jgi:serine/threonine protein kinase